MMTSTLSSTDTNLTGLAGSATVRLENGTVRVNVSMTGIPQNVIQIHYGFINAQCNLLNIQIPNDATGSTRSYNISETLSTDALSVDLQSSGASTSTGDLNLDGKSFVVKAFTNFAGTPNPTGTNVLNIACGQLSIADTDDNNNGTQGGTFEGVDSGIVGGAAGDTFDETF